MTPYDHWKTTDFEGDVRMDAQEAIEAIYEKFKADPEKVREADEWGEGQFSAGHYSELESAMADLNDINPSYLFDSFLLQRLYRLAKQHGSARRERLMQMAEDEYNKGYKGRED